MARVIGAKNRADRLRRMTGEPLVRRVGAALFAGGSLIEVEAAHSITEGAVSGKGHIPSAAGTPPNADTHVLDRSIQTVQVGPLKVEVFADAPYAVDQEFGNSKLPERPYMRPAVAKKRDEVTALVRGAVSSVIRDSKGA